MPALSVVVPTLNESAHLGHLIDQLASQRGLDFEVVVADGGSTDGTQQIVHTSSAVLVESARGRGRQLNAGRAVARAPLLLFLHADSRLTGPRQLASAVHAFQAACQDQAGPLAGHFQLRFYDAQGTAFTYYEGLSALGRPQTVNGDQGLLIHAQWLDELGGFHETLPFLEDQDLGARIRTAGRWVLLPGRLETSARRFIVEGVAERSIHNAITMAFFSFRYAPFFATGRPRYRLQHNSGRLAVAPLAREVWAFVRQEPRILLPLARYVNRHALWRAAFWLDVRAWGSRAVEHHPWLRRYDRWMASWTHNRLFDLLWTIPALAGFFTMWRWWSNRRPSPQLPATPSVQHTHLLPAPQPPAGAPRPARATPPWSAAGSSQDSAKTHSQPRSRCSEGHAPDPQPR